MTTERSAEEVARMPILDRLECHARSLEGIQSRAGGPYFEATKHGRTQRDLWETLIEARAEIERLKAALEPFATAMDRAGVWPALVCKDTDRLSPDIHFTAQMITFGDLRRARAVYQQSTPGEK